MIKQGDCRTEFLIEIKSLVDSFLDNLNPNEDEIPGAINWGDSSCTEVCWFETHTGECGYSILIEEADPNNFHLCQLVENFIRTAVDFTDDVDVIVRCEW